MPHLREYKCECERDAELLTNCYFIILTPRGNSVARGANPALLFLRQVIRQQGVACPGVPSLSGLGRRGVDPMHRLGSRSLSAMRHTS